jgi:hypothetical protein
MTQSRSPTEALGETIRKALTRAWHLGQTYWQQGDSESYSQNRKSDETLATFRAFVDDTIAALSQPQQPSGWRDIAPEGWKLVPIEPTDEMETAAENDYEQRGETFPDWKSKWRAMLAAAPAHPAEQQERTLPWHIPVQHWDNAEKAALGNSAAPAEQQEGGDAAMLDWMIENEAKVMQFNGCYSVDGNGRHASGRDAIRAAMTGGSRG